MPVGAPPAPPTAWLDVDWSPFTHDADVDGRRLRYCDYGEGPPIVCVHGLGGNWQTWLNNITALGAHHRVIAVDLPGFGHSEPLPPPAAMTTQAASVAELLDQLGVTGATLVGHSMGGIVIRALRRARPDLVARVVMANAGGIPLTPARLALIVNGFKVFYFLFARDAVMRAVTRRPRLRRAAFAGFMGNHDELRGPFAREVVPVMFAPGFLGAVVAAGQVAGEPMQPGEMDCPVLLVWGAEDRILPLAEARTLAASLPDARLVVLDGVGHCPMFEAPKAFNDAVLAFTTSEGSPA